MENSYLNLIPALEPPKRTAMPPARKHRAAVQGDGAVAKGTKGRQVLDVVHSLGGKALAVPIADKMTGLGQRNKAVKKVRTYIYSLSHAETPYLEKTAERGVWQLTDKAYEVLGQPKQKQTAEEEEVTM